MKLHQSLFILAGLLLLPCCIAFSQTISGPARVCAGSTVTYSVTGLYAYNWSVEGGTLLSDPEQKSISVRWGTTGGRVAVSGPKDKWEETWGWDDLDVGMMVGGTASIGPNSAFTGSVSSMPVVTVCAGSYSGMLTLSGSAGPILRWEYRYDASTWQPIYHTGSTYSFSATRTTFYRAVVGNTTCEVYSQTATLYFPNPTSPTVTDKSRCGAGTIAFGAYLKDAASYRWYPSQYSSDVLSTTATYEPYVTASREFWVSGVVQGCEGPRARVYGTINQLPAYPDVGIDRYYSCGNTRVSVPLVAPEGETYYWQTSDVSTQFTDNAPTSSAKTLTTSGKVYFNSRINSTGCFGPVESHDVTVYPTTPQPQLPSIKAENCGSTTLQSAVPTTSRTAYYWQTQPDGKSTANAGEMTVTASGTYYLRSTFFGEDCWSAAVPLQVTIRRSACIEQQSSSQNYVVTNVVLREGVTDASQLPYLTAAENKVDVAYSDGLGRESQSVMLEGSPYRSDIVQIKEYDATGKESRVYLPYSRPGAGGKFRDAAVQEQQLFYSEPDASAGDRAGTAVPWEETLFEASPLGRIKEKGAAGEPWQIGNNTARIKLMFNTANQVRRWTYDFVTGRCTSPGFYDEGVLAIEEITDENGSKKWSFKDRENRVVLTKVEISATMFAYTYYVFDSFSKLRMVIQPEGVKQLQESGIASPDDNFVDRWCFTYRYDRFGRVAEKKAPGAAPVYHIYNKRNELILTQDGEQRKRREWSFTKYDDLKRVILTGIYKHTADMSQADMQQLAYAHPGIYEWRSGAAAGVKFGYTLTYSFPALSDANAVIHLVNYYDDYNFDFDTTTPDPAYIASGMSPEPVSSLQVTGQLTGSCIATLSTGQMLLTVNFYDKRGHAIQTQKDNHAGGKDIVTKRYDFTGKVREEHLRHQTSAANVTVRKWLTYDHLGRLLTVQQKVNNDAIVTVASLAYNELGQVTAKKLHSTDGNSFLQTLDMRYNIRGWLSRINDAALSDPSDLFGLELLRNEVVRLNNTRRQYNGNIAELVYNDRLQNKQRGYGFTYDGHDRMTSAAYRALNASGLPADVDARNEEGIVYDLNGNIRQLTRRNPEGDKFLQYIYAGNVLTGISVNNGASENPVPDQDHPRPEEPEESIAASSPAEEGITASAATDQCAYDANGNLISDLRRGLTVEYNHMNLPTLITRQGKGQIRYTYDALGARLSKSVTDSTGITRIRTYAGTFEYGDGMTLESFPTGEGRVLMKSSTPEYQYYLKDHLGNIRLTFTATPATLTSVATLESAKAGEENNKFLHYDEAVKVNYPLFNHTANAATKYATRLNGTSKERIGLARSISVMPGDVVKMEVFAKYLDTERTNWSSALQTFMSAIAAGTAPAGTVVDGGAAGSIGNGSFPLAQLVDKSNSSGAGPKAYLNFLVFDRSFNYRDGGFIRLSQNAKENGTGVAHERLARELTIKEPGYVYVFLSNENETPVEVYFDDFSVTQVQSAIVSGEEYYPFGATFNSFARDNSVSQPHLFNGKERQQELGLDWDDFGARMYNPETGRWNSIDPLADKYQDVSPYNFVLNNPVRNTDPDGRVVVIDKDASPEFRRQVWQAIEYLHANGADAVIGALISSPFVYTIVDARKAEDPKDRYSRYGLSMIFWNPELGILTSNIYPMSPAEVLNHEVGHALDDDAIRIVDKLMSDAGLQPKYRPPQEKSDAAYEDMPNVTVVKDPEQWTAKKLGKLPLVKDYNRDPRTPRRKEVTRKDHSGYWYFKAPEVSYPTATQMKERDDDAVWNDRLWIGPGGTILPWED